MLFSTLINELFQTGASFGQQTCSSRDSVHLEGVRSAARVYRELFRRFGSLPTRRRSVGLDQEKSIGLFRRFLRHRRTQRRLSKRTG